MNAPTFSPSPPRPESVAPFVDPMPAQVKIRPLDCTDLRMIATWSADFLNHEVTFDYDGTSGDIDEPRLSAIVGSIPSRPADSHRVVIPTGTASRASELREMQAWVSYQPTGSSEHVPVSGAPVAVTEWDAAFWTESAVEKFLVPYIAALGGPTAQRMLADVLRVWNEYPPELRVFGLLRRARPRHDVVGLEELIDVVFLDCNEDRIEIAPLHDARFQAAHPVLQAPSHPVPFRPGILPAHPDHLPSEFHLRRTAEWASACRSEPVYFAFDTTSGQFHTPVPLENLPEDLNNLLVIPAYTEPTRADRPRVTRVRLIADDGAHKDLDPDKGDAVFWGSGAVEHLMIPYYASVYGHRAIEMLGRIHGTWWEEAEMRILGAPIEVYALVHLPKSDWDPADDPALSLTRMAAALVGGETVKGLQLRTLRNLAVRTDAA